MQMAVNMLDNRRITRSMSSEKQARVDCNTNSSLPSISELPMMATECSKSHGIGEEDNTMEMLAYFRNPSEEILLRGVLDNTSASGSLEGIGLQFPHLSASYRVSSEELFNSWISNSADPGQQGISRRMSSELAAVLAHQQQRIPTDVRDDSGPNINQLKPPRFPNKGAGVSFQVNWFQQSYPMTRSRSNELRRRYLAIQEACGNSEDATAVNHAGPPDARQEDNSTLSTVVNMLKGSLQRKRHVDDIPDQAQVLSTYLATNRTVSSPSESCAGGAQSNNNSASNGNDSQRTNHLLRAASLGSDGEDSTKKRRVERKRMMTEAKGRGQMSATPSEIQATTKRCEALEKEVRSLKLNLSFMNRKDSEQTKKIEDLEFQNEQLIKDKEQLLEELDHISSDVRY